MQSFIEKKSKMHAMNTKKAVNNRSGFTLVELMIVVLLTGIAVIAIYRGYTAFSHSADVQEQIIEMQQSLRIGIYTLAKDMMQAGVTEEDNEIVLVDSNRKNVAAVTFLTASNYPDLNLPDDPIVEFGMDLGSGGEFAGDGLDNDGDGDVDEEDEIRVGDDDFNDDGERIRYRLSNPEDANDNDVLDVGEDANDNGILDKSLQREVWTCDPATGVCDYGAPQTIITNVSAINFTYLQEDGVTELSPLPLSEADRSLIDTVEITMVVRTTNEDLRITNDDPYSNQLGTWTWTPNPPDHFRRRVMSTRIKIRNANM